MSKTLNLSKKPQENPRLSKEQKRQRREERDRMIEEVLSRKSGWIKNPRDYWEACLVMTYAIGYVIQFDKMVSSYRANYRDKSKHHDITSVVHDRKNFPNGINDVKDGRVKNFSRLCGLLDAINWYSVENGLVQLNIVKLFSVFPEPEDREKARKYILRHLEVEDAPFELDTLPSRDFP